MLWQLRKVSFISLNSLLSWIKHDMNANDSTVCIYRHLSCPTGGLLALQPDAMEWVSLLQPLCVNSFSCLFWLMLLDFIVMAPFKSRLSSGRNKCLFEIYPSELRAASFTGSHLVKQCPFLTAALSPMWTSPSWPTSAKGAQLFLAAQSLCYIQIPSCQSSENCAFGEWGCWITSLPFCYWFLLVCQNV